MPPSYKPNGSTGVEAAVSAESAVRDLDLDDADRGGPGERIELLRGVAARLAVG
jgi:hypothetical protein